MAHGAPDLSDLLAVIEEPTVVPPLHQISSGQSGNSQMQMGASGFFSPPNLSFPTELNAQSQLGQIPELEHDLSESAFLPTDLHGHSFKDSTFQVENEDRGSLGSLFLSSIGHQLDSGKPETVPFVPSMSLQGTSKIALSKPKQQSNPPQQMRSSSQPLQRSTNAAKSNYSQFGSSMTLSSGTEIGASGSALKSSNSTLRPLPFIAPTDLQPAIANVQPGASQKKVPSSGQFAFPHGMRQQSLPTNPPRPQSATSNSSDHMSRPGSVQQPSPSCGSSHSGDPATPLTPQSYNAGTPQPYKPATPGNPSAIQQQRRPGFVDIHHSPQISQVASNQQTVTGYQPQTSTTQPIISSNEALDDLPTPIKNAFDSIGSIPPFHPQNDGIDTTNLWNAGSALMAPSALFVSTPTPQLQSNPVMATPDQNLGLGIPSDMYGVNLPMYTSRVPRNEPSFEESLTPKQNEILNQLSAKGLKKPSSLSAQLSSMPAVNETATVIQTSSNVNATTMDMMNKANTAGTATVEKLLGSSQYEAISPVSDYSMSPTNKSALPEELTDNLYISSKFPSEIELPTSQQNQSPMNQDLTDPVMMYTTQKVNTGGQRDLPDLLGPDEVPELLSFPEHDWSTPNSSIPSSQMQSSLTITSQLSKPNVSVAHHGHVSSNHWSSNSVVSPDYVSSVNLSHQSGHEDISLSDYAPTAKIAASSLKEAQSLSSQKQVPSHTMSVNSKDARSFVTSRHKPSSDKAKGNTKSTKSTGQSDSAFGFESDDETETIRLMPPSSQSKKPAKVAQQPNFPPVKPRTMHPVGPSEELRQKMEAVKQLQQQQIRLQQIQAYQSQNASASNPNIQNSTLGRHNVQFQNKTHLLHAGIPQTQPQHDAARNKISVGTTGVSHLTDSTTSHSHLFGSLTSTNLLTQAKTSNTSVPLSLAQPNPSYVDISRYKTPQSLFQAEPQFSASKSSTVQRSPYFVESIPKSSSDPVDLLATGTGSDLTPVREEEEPHAAISSVSHSTISSSLPVFPPQIPRFSPPWKPTTVPSSIGLVSTPPSHQTIKQTVGPTHPTNTLPVTPALLTDHSNLDWLHRDPEPGITTSNSRLDFLNTVMRPSNSEKVTSSTLDTLSSTPRSTTSENIADTRLDFLNTVTRSSAQGKIASSRIDFFNSSVQSSAGDKIAYPRFDFLNAMTRPSVGGKTSGSTFDILKSTVRSSTGEKNANSGPDFSSTVTRSHVSEKSFTTTLDVNAMTRPSAGEKNQSFRPDRSNNMSRPSTSVSTGSHIPSTNSRPPSSSVQSFSASNTSLLSEDYLVPLKQSIHNIDHTGTAKTLPSMPTTFTPTATVKKHPINETRQINFKKHRILEGALPSTTFSVKSTSISTGSAFSTSSVSVACSVLDKQRRYLKEHGSSRLKHRTAQVQDTVQLSSNLSGSTKERVPELKSQSSDSNKSDASNKSSSEQGETSGGMFELFSSLLKEASESALKTRIESKETEPEKPVEKVTNSQPAAVSTTIKQKSDTSSALAVSTVSTQLISKPVTSDPIVNVATTTSLASVATSRSASEIKKPAKKNWSSAIPFKRRYFDDTQSQFSIASKTSVPVSAVMTSRLKPIVSLPKITVTTATSTESLASTSVKVPPKITLTTSSMTAPVVSLSVKLPPKITTTTSSTTAGPVVSVASFTPVNSEKESVAAGGALKLRITAFRSSRGDIIHQSAMLNKDEDSSMLDRNSHKRSKKKKRKRDKKRKNDASSSDDNSSVVQSKADPREQLIEKAKLNEQITKELVELAKITSIEETDVATSSKLSPQKRKRTKGDAADVEVIPKKPKRTRVTKSNPKKKQDSKVVEPVARYLPKSVLQASSGASVVSATKTTVSIPATYQRAPGKLPLYLSSSDRNSSTAPTIQLVARSSTKVVVSTTAESKSAQHSKAPKTMSSRSLSTQLLSNSNVQYIIPTTRSQPRVILPNVSTSAAVSVVSPLIVRSFPAGLVSLPTSAPSATAIPKPQLFTFPVTITESASHTLKSISTKTSEKAKTRAQVGTSNSSSCTLTHSSPAKKSSSSVTFSTNSRSTTGLTGTLDTPRVTTKVLPPSIDQESNVNNFQSVLLKLITSPNPVPNYVPPDPPRAICQDLTENETFQCLACEDRFLFNDSLEDHHARRSILIKVRCMQCDQDMVFLNKCKLLMHARQHSDGMQFNNAHISPLPLSMCKPRSKEWFLNNKNANDESVQRQASIASHESCSPTTPVVESPAALPTTLVCTECNFIAPTAEALEEHFQRTSTQTSPEKAAEGNKAVANFMCDICSVTVPNQCSFLAHMRMHKRAKPHTCPECGKMFNDAGLQEPTYSESKKEIDFNFHLSIECFHLCRMTAFKCRICNLICKNAELLRRHLEDRHLQTFHKCLDCPMAFKTQENFASHQRSAHSVSPLTKMMYKCPKTIHKCPLCDTVFTDDNATQQLFLLQKHFEGHMSHPSINITAYKCLFCNDIFEKKAQVRDHIKTVHDVVASSDGDLNTSKGFMDSGLRSNSSKRSRTADMDEAGPSRKIARTVLSGEATASNVRIAFGSLGSRDGHKRKMVSPGDLVTGKKNALQPLKLRLKGLSPRVPDQPDVDDQIDHSPDVDVALSTIPSVETIMRDGRRLFPCGQCPKELPSASARVNHIRLKHQGIRTLFCCPYCPAGKIKFAKKISMKKHLKKVHGMDEVAKQDVRIEYVKLPIGQRFDRASLNAEEGTASPPIAYKSSSTPTGSKVRKKITRPGRRNDRPPRQVRQDVMNPNLYLDNSDSEVERIMRNKVAHDASFDKTEVSDEEPDFSDLKFPLVYRCAKCDHQCEDRLEFQAHIIEHKEDAEAEGITGMMQCTECGLCFASASSHIKHLFIKHKIRKGKLLEKFDEQLKARRKAEGTLPYRLSEEFLNNPNGTCDSNVKKYKCAVCFKRFEEDAKLKTHMRTHGLAFVRSKHVS